MTAVLNVDDLFKGRQFDREVIILYSLHALISAIQVQLPRPRGNEGGMRIVCSSHDDHALGPTLCSRIRKAVEPFCSPRGQIVARRQDFVKIEGRRTYLCRAVDKAGKTVDFLLRANRDVAAAKEFCRRAFASRSRLPHKITLDGYQASHRAAREVLKQRRGGARTEIRSSKCLNKLIEQDDRSIKLRLGGMLGLKRFRNALTTITGVHLLRRIRKGQFKLGALRVKKSRAPDIWNAILAA